MQAVFLVSLKTKTEGGVENSKGGGHGNNKRRLAQEQTSESEYLGHYVRFPVEIAIQQTFPF